jgi:hypothetical protein
MEDKTGGHTSPNTPSTKFTPLRSVNFVRMGGLVESVEKAPRTYFEELLIKQGDKKRRI